MNAKDIISEATAEQEELYRHVRDAADWFHEHEGELFQREEAVKYLEEKLDVDSRIAANLVAELVSDIVDPVVQVMVGVQRYVGVAEYVEGDGWYGYVDYDDAFGARNRVVCAQCVHESETDLTVTHATGGDGSFRDEPDATYDELAEAIEEHYEEAHDGIVPEDVETGASLISGTTIGGNTAWHAGNDGGGSGLDADTVDGVQGADLAVDPPIFGDGSDGSITRSGNGNENGRIFASNYTLNSGISRTVSNGIVVLHATGEIRIDGTLDADGQGGAPGTGGAGGPSVAGTGNSPKASGQAGSPGNQGSSADIVGSNATGGTGGGGGSGSPNSGGNGGAGSGGSGGGGGGGGGASSGFGSRGGGAGADGGAAAPESLTTAQIDRFHQVLTDVWNGFYDLTYAGGSGGSGGGGGGSGASASSASSGAGGDGGDGGAGGGVIVLLAPKIVGNGTVTASGLDGSPGLAGGNSSGNTAGGGGGGGGAGGHGGTVVTVSSQVESNLTFTAAGGTGGSGGAAGDGPDSDGGIGGDGGNGDPGLVVHIGDQP